MTKPAANYFAIYGRAVLRARMPGSCSSILPPRWYWASRASRRLNRLARFCLNPYCFLGMRAPVPNEDVHPTVPPHRSIQRVCQREVGASVKTDWEAHHIEEVIATFEAEAKRR